ncbi:MAG: hypothetical protein HYV27_19315 [Candidatus Hydrogenedentes bacterium]|nr:hypothetical protein [Candidatus Hydrogenedentota bacterium]
MKELRQTAATALYMSWFVTLCLVSICSPVLARDEQGALGILRLPNEGRPAVALAGDSFPVEAWEQGELQLVGESGSVPLAVRWEQDTSRPASGIARLPAQSAPGWYALRLQGSKGTDETPHAVHIAEEWKDYYAFGLIAATEARPLNPANLAESLAALAESDVRAASLQGLAIAADDPIALQRVLDLLRICPIPVFVGGAAEGSGSLALTRHFGPSAFVFTYGEDAYYSLAPLAWAAEDSVGMEPGNLHRQRRAHRRCRWSAAICAGSAGQMGIRNSTILFVDDPVDYVLCVLPSIPEVETPIRARQGRSMIYQLPPAVERGIHVIDVTPAKGLLLRAPSEPPAAP